MVDRSMPRVCFHQTVSVSDHVLQPSQAFALFYQSLIFSGRNLATLKWISIHVGIPSGLELLMIDTNGDVMLDDALLHQRLCQAKRNGDQRASDSPSILKWISLLILRLITDHSLPSGVECSCELTAFREFLAQFHMNAMDDRSTLSDDEGIGHDQSDEEDISQRAIHQALKKCLSYLVHPSPHDQHAHSIEVSDLESNPTSRHSQEILQILCRDTLALNIELARNLPSSSKTSLVPTPICEPELTSFYFTWVC